MSFTIAWRSSSPTPSSCGYSESIKYAGFSSLRVRQDKEYQNQNAERAPGYLFIARVEKSHGSLSAIFPERFGFFLEVLQTGVIVRIFLKVREGDLRRHRHIIVGDVSCGVNAPVLQLDRKADAELLRVHLAPVDAKRIPYLPRLFRSKKSFFHGPYYIIDLPPLPCS